MIGAHLDRIRRSTASLRRGVLTRDLDAGWVGVRPGFPEGDVPSSSYDRAFFLSPPRILSLDDIDAAIDVFRSHGRGRGYLWLAPWACTPDMERQMVVRGVTPWPFVDYVALARSSETHEPSEAAFSGRGAAFAVRAVRAAESHGVLPQMAGWYSSDGIDTALQIVDDNAGEAWVAFHEDTPVGLGLLTLDGEFGHLWAAGTAPAFRGQGVQAALIGRRVARTRDAGCRWCTVETNSMVPISLRNLRRGGFEVAIRWRVHQWIATPR